MGGGGGFGGGGGGGGRYEELPQEEEEEEVDLYERIGVEAEATTKEIKTAYRKMSVIHHPDKNGGGEAAIMKFREITEAYEILSDPEKRVLYDHTGIAAARKGLQAQEEGGSPFDMFFGGGGRQESKRGRNMEIELPVTLEDLYVGNEKSATVKRRIVCKNCKKKMQTPRCRECGACPKEKKMVHRREGHARWRGYRLQVRERAEAGADPGRRRAQAQVRAQPHVQAQPRHPHNEALHPSARGAARLRDELQAPRRPHCHGQAHGRHAAGPDDPHQGRGHAQARHPLRVRRPHHPV